MFERLERQHGRAHVARLAVPDQLDLALVLEQDEAVFLRQRLALLDQLDQVALFGVGQVVGFLVWSCHAQVSWYSREARGQPGERCRRVLLEALLIDVDEAVARPAFVLAGLGGVGAPLAQARHLLRQVELLAALGLDDPDRRRRWCAR